MTDDFLILGSDGVVEALSYTELVKLVWQTAYELQTSNSQNETKEGGILESPARELESFDTIPHDFSAFIRS